MTRAWVVAVPFGIITAVAGCDRTAPPTPMEPAPAQELRLPRERHTVGELRTISMDVDSTMAFSDGQQQAVLVTTVRREERREALAVDPSGLIVRARYTYDEHREVLQMGLDRHEKPSPLLGKTYIVAREGDQLVVTRPDGTVPEGAEYDALLQDHDDFGAPDRLSSAIGDRAYRIGEKVTLTAEELGRAGGDQRAANVPAPATEQEMTALELTLRRVDGSVAHFDLMMRMRERNADMAMEQTLHGTLSFDADTGQARELAASGAIGGTFQGATVKGETRVRMAGR